MSKPSLFIGSSTENLELARTVQSSLEYDASPIVWTQGIFPPSHFPLEALESSLDKADFAVFICAPDDKTLIRGEQRTTVRDNVIFELGLFIGRLGRKRTFLISPRGAELHLPSDLSGLYPETFDPEQASNPEAALGPACNKIRTVMRELGALQRPSGDLQDAEGARNDDSQPTTPPQLPSPDWLLQDYQRAIFFALLRGDSEAASQVDAAFRASQLAVTAELIAEWEAWREVANIPAGNRVDLKLLRNHANAYPENPRLKEFLGRGLSHYGDDKGAAEAYRGAAQLAKEMELAARVIKRALEAGKGLHEVSSAITLKSLLHGLPQNNHEDKLAFVEGMQSISETAKLAEISKAIAEVSLSLAPEDTSARFELARRYAEDNQHHLSMLHYQSIPPEDREGTAWNNLGVSYANLKIPGMATKAYEVAAGLGETIADGNLARKLSSAGFFDEAQERVEKAIAIPDHHASLIGVLSSIKEGRETDEASLQDAQSKAKEQQIGRLAIGESALNAIGIEIEGIWLTPLCRVSLRNEGDGRYIGTGEIAKETKQAAGAFPGLFTSIRASVETSKVVVRLVRFGNALEGTLTIESSAQPLTLLGTISREKRLVLHITQDGFTLDGLEIGYDEERISWHRSELAAIDDDPVPSNPETHLN